MVQVFEQFQFFFLNFLMSVSFVSDFGFCNPFRYDSSVKCAIAFIKSPPNMRHGVYVLALQHGGFYIGRLNDIDAHIKQHRDGTGAAAARGAVIRAGARQ